MGVSTLHDEELLITNIDGDMDDEEEEGAKVAGGDDAEDGDDDEDDADDDLSDGNVTEL